MWALPQGGGLGAEENHQRRAGSEAGGRLDKARELLDEADPRALLLQGGSPAP
jgi:hypothetical protein